MHECSNSTYPVDEVGLNKLHDLCRWQRANTMNASQHAHICSVCTIYIYV